jgi:predicted TPR repeat methyltransferase
MSLLRVNPSVVICFSEGGCLAYNIDSNELRRLNPAAALMVELCDGSRSGEEILATIGPLMGEGGIGGCAAWLDEARSQKLIIDGNPSASEIPMTASRLSELSKALRHKDHVLAAFICQHRAAELAPDDPQQAYLLGELAHIVGYRAEARAAYERYHQANPQDVEVEHLLIALRDETPPARASNTYIEELYSYFAPFYEENVCGDLDYRAPQILFEAITQAMRSSGQFNVLDLGCGTGLFGQRIRPLARFLHGIDLSSAMLDRARRRGIYDHLETAEITAWLANEATARFDVIAICDTLIYFGDLSQVLPHAARHLADCGILAFTVEAGETYPWRLTDSGRFAHHRDHLTEVAEAGGLRIVSLNACTLRHEYGRPVSGWIAVMSLIADDHSPGDGFSGKETPVGGGEVGVAESKGSVPDPASLLSLPSNGR